jgi:hypothetical protein
MTRCLDVHCAGSFHRQDDDTISLMVAAFHRTIVWFIFRFFCSADAVLDNQRGSAFASSGSLPGKRRG